MISSMQAIKFERNKKSVLVHTNIQPRTKALSFLNFRGNWNDFVDGDWISIITIPVQVI